MKFLKSLFSIALLLNALPAFASEWYEPRLPFEEAVIEYKVDGMMKGSKTLYIRDYGKESAEYSDKSMSMMGMVQQQKEIIITDKDWVYTYDLVQRTGYKTINPAKIFKEELQQYSASERKTIEKNAEKFGMDMVSGLQGDVQKKAATILGYQCDVTNMAGVTLYSIADTGFPLKMETNMMGMRSSEEVISIDETAPPAGKFKQPANIRVEYDREDERMMRAQIRSTLQNLLAGQKGSRDTQASPYGMPANQGEQRENSLTPEQQQQLQEMMQRFGQQQ